MFTNMKYPLLWKAVTLLCTQACFTPALAAPVKSAAQSRYTVKSGDTFAKIARSKGISLGALLQANRIENPNHIVLGQQIVLPGNGTAAAKPVTTTAECPCWRSAQTWSATRVPAWFTGNRPASGHAMPCNRSGIRGDEGVENKSSTGE